MTVANEYHVVLRHGLHGRRDILAATLTLNHHALRDFWSGEHEIQYRRIKGESNPQYPSPLYSIRVTSEPPVG
jgi:hypothetical protein